MSTTTSRLLDRVKETVESTLPKKKILDPDEMVERAREREVKEKEQEKVRDEQERIRAAERLEDMNLRGEVESRRAGDIWVEANQLAHRHGYSDAMKWLTAYVLEWPKTFLFISPYYILLGRDVDISGERGWHVEFAVGRKSLEILLTLMPYYLPAIGWKGRNGEYRWYHTETLFDKLGVERKERS